MSKVTFILTALLVFGAASTQAKSVVDIVEKGNKAYEQQEYKGALEQYQIAETEIPESSELDYNIANVLFQQGKYEEAIDRYTKSLNTKEIDLEALGQYNLGNTYYRMGDFQNAIKSYENSLRINPNDLDAKYNLELARRMLKEQMKQQEQQQDQQQKQDKQEEQQQEQEQPKPDEQQQDKQDQQQQNQDQQQQQQQQQQQNQQQQSDEQKMSQEDAERILNALADDEQDVQKKVKRQVVGGGYTGKDW